MFYLASKIFWIVAAPFQFTVLLGLAGVLLLITRRRRLGAILMTISIVVIATVGVLPIGNVLMQPLEDRFPAWDPARGPPDGIIVLAGAVNARISDLRSQPALDASAERITAAAALARTYPKAAIVYSGGNGPLFTERFTPEAKIAARLLGDLGVASTRITLETRSRNTAENALLTKELVHPAPQQRWLLVTSAFHMPRAVGAFRKAGFPVQAYPVDWQTGGRQLALSTSFAGGWKLVDIASKEWLGLVVYWLTGRTSTLFPGP